MASAVPPRLQARKAFDFPATPQYSGFSMEMQPSPAFSNTPLRHHRESPTPSDDNLAKPDASASMRRIRITHFGRIILSIVLIAAGAAIVGCEARALHTYNSTNLSSEWFLPLWPQNLDLRPSIVILVGGAVVALTNCVYLCCALLPACSPRLSILNLLLIAISLLGLVASAFTAGFSANIYGKTDPGHRETVRSWTCLWYDGAKASGTASLSTSSSLSAPAGFSRACLESHAAFDLLVVALILEVGVVGLSGAGYWMERKLV